MWLSCHVTGTTTSGAAKAENLHVHHLAHRHLGGAKGLANLNAVASGLYAPRFSVLDCTAPDRQSRAKSLRLDARSS